MFRRFLAGVLSVIFVTVSIPLAFVWGMYQTFSDRDFYEEELVDVAYDFMITEVPARLSELEEFSSIGKDDFSDLIEKIILKEDLRKVVTSLIDQASEVTVNEKEQVELKIPLSWVSDKDDLIAREISNLLYEKIPACGEEVIVDCIPADFSKVDFETDVKRTLDIEFFANIPGDFAFYVNVPPGIDGKVLDAFADMFGFVFYAGTLSLLLILLLIGLLVFHPILRVLKWEVKAISTAALFLTILLVLMLYLPDILDEAFYSQLVNDVNESDIVAVGRLFNLMIVSVAENLLFYSVPILVISVMSWIALAFRSKESETL